MDQQNHDQILFLGHINFRGKGSKFGIRRADRRYHSYIIGQTGTGKTSLMENMIVQDIQNGEGVAVLDPHGDLVERLIKQIPKHRKGDLIVPVRSPTGMPGGLAALPKVGSAAVA